MPLLCERVVQDGALRTAGDANAEASIRKKTVMPASRMRKASFEIEVRGACEEDAAEATIDVTVVSERRSPQVPRCANDSRLASD